MVSLLNGRCVTCECVCTHVYVHACVSLCVCGSMTILYTQDIHQQSIDDDLTSVTELAYFEGDFWPSMIEEQIKELDQKVAMCILCVQCVHIYLCIHSYLTQ